MTTRNLLTIAALALVFAFGSNAAIAQPPSSTTAPARVLEPEAGQWSYAIGLDLGRSLALAEEYFDRAALMAGVDDALRGASPRFTAEQIERVKLEVTKKLQEKQMAERTSLADRNKSDGERYLASNAEKTGVTVTSSGLQYEVLREGAGPKPSRASKVKVNYAGRLIDGTEFDSSYARGQPVSFSLDSVIPGWTEGLQLMSAGSKYRLAIPSELGYADRGAGAKIGPNVVLVFEIELLEIE